MEWGAEQIDEHGGRPVVKLDTPAMAQDAKDQAPHVRPEKVARPAARYPHRREEINNVGILPRPQTIIITTKAIE